MAALSGPGGSTLRTFDTLTGHLLLEKRVHSPEAGGNFEHDLLGTSIAFIPGSNQLLVLTGGHTLNCIDRKTGETSWTWTSEDQACVPV